jgi:3-hydroxyisobutyrate dehydrogenase
MQVTVLGTGIMGTALTRTLIRAGHSVTVWNRSPERAEPLRKDGATVAGSAREAVQGADVVLLTLFDAAAVLAVMTDAMSAAPDAVWVQASTIGIAGARDVAAAADGAGARLLEVMMLGTKAPAEQGSLTLLVSGSEEYDATVAPVFDAIAAKVLRVGPEIGQASALKLATNAWVGAITAATAQSLALASGLGLPPQLFLDAIADAPVDSRYAHVKGGAMLEQSFAPSFSVDGVVKDIDLMVAAASEAGVPADLLLAVQGFFRSASDTGHGDDDMAAVVTAFGPVSGPG